MESVTGWYYARSLLLSRRHFSPLYFGVFFSDSMVFVLFCVYVCVFFCLRVLQTRTTDRNRSLVTADEH